MAEYKSFPYLMHKAPEPTKAFYVEGPKPLSFPELYSPREPTKCMISKSEKSYWRTRDRIEYTMWEDRKAKLLIVTCYNVEAKEPLRTIFLNLEILYYEVESKARGTRDQLTKKKDKKLVEDNALWKAVSEYVLARLNITADPLKWPTSFGTAAASAAATADVTTTQGVISSSTTTTTAPSVNAGGDPSIATNPDISTDVSTTSSTSIADMERMCTLDKMTNDEYDQLEISCPYPVVPNGSIPTELEGIDRLKLYSTAAVAAATSATAALVVSGSTSAAVTSTSTAITEKPQGGVDSTAGGASTLDKPANPPAKVKKTPATATAPPAATNAPKKDGKKKVVPT